MSSVVFALGGNLLVADDGATYGDQVETIRSIAARLAPHYSEHEIVLTHGNGPQIGYRLLESETAETPDLPLDVLVAQTQAQIGYLLSRALDARLDSVVPSLDTRVIVDPHDPAFEERTKPIGPFYTATEAAEKPFETVEVRESDPAYRRVVASPEPREVVEGPAIEALLEAEIDSICAGGGGVPVVETDDGFEGRSAVIDKDRTSRLLGERINADRLVFLTDVQYAYLDYGSDSREPIEEVDPATLREYADAGEFGEGTMAPKVEACACFVESGGTRAVITRPEDVDAALEGEAGTQVREQST